MHHWYERTVIYELPPALFKDGNGDGVGDFLGATQTLDYLANLGVDSLWLQPFYVSPRRDDGYDIADYYQVDPRFGNGGEFVQFTEEAERRGLHVIVDIAFQHTSDQHAWFQSARSSRDSKYRDFYLWSDEAVDLPGDKNVLGRETVWTYDDLAGQYYHHSFYPFQPDLNLGHPPVIEEFKKILHFWLQLGVSGFRLDAVPHMVRPKSRGRSREELFALLGELRSFVSEKNPDAILVGEVDTEPPNYAHYFGDEAERLRVLLNFYLPGHAFLAFARGDAGPLRSVLADLPTPPKNAVYANFLRNHDELDLERLNEHEQREVQEAFAPDERMRVFGRNIRRRLAPMLGDDPRRMRLAFSLLFSLPGVPVLYYGDEIGMGEDLSLEERQAVRTPMQWSDEPNAGFSTAPPEDLVAPVISGGPFGYERRNVMRQRLDGDSLLNWTNRLARARRDCPEFGLAGGVQVLDAGDDRVLAHCCIQDGNMALAIHNLSGDEVEVKLDLPRCEATLLEMMSDHLYEPFRAEGAKIGPYGYRWFRCHAFHQGDRTTA